MKLNEAIDTALSQSNLSKQTLRTYRCGLRKFMEYNQIDTDMINLTIDPFIRFLSWLQGEQLSKSTMQTYRASVIFLVEWLIDIGHLKPSAEERVRFDHMAAKISKRHQERIPKMPGKFDASKMVDAATRQEIWEPIKSRDIAIAHLLKDTGLRRGELASLKVRDFNMADHVVRVKGKGDKDAYQPFLERTAIAIRKYWEARGWFMEDDPAFARHDKKVSTKHAPMTGQAVWYVVKRLAELAGFHFSPHWFRHSFGMAVIEKTHDLALAQDLLRHSSPSATRIYAKITQDDLKKGYHEAFDE